MEEQEKISEASYGGSYQRAQDTVQLKVPYSFIGNQYGVEEIEAMIQALKGESLTMGAYVQKFQEAFGQFVGATFACACTHCTGALEMATEMCQIRPGDEVIVPAITFVATSIPTLRAGGKVVFADLDPVTLNMDPRSVEAKITPRTRAIFPVHYAGLCVDMDPIMELAKKHNLLVVEDCAHTPGAEYKGRRAGALGDIGCFSFHTIKNMTTLGEGGMFTCMREEWRDEIPKLRFVGMYEYPNQGKYWLPYHYQVDLVRGAVPNNFCITEAQAAVGLVQLRRLESFNERRRKIAAYLNAELSQIEGMQVPVEPEGYKHVYHLYAPLYDGSGIGATRDDFVDVIYHEFGVQPIMHYWPTYKFKLYQDMGYSFNECPQADAIYDRLLNLPIYPHLTDGQVEYMADACKKTVARLAERRQARLSFAGTSAS